VLPVACRDGHDLAARTDLALASLWSGLALANAGLGAVHGFAAPIGGLFPAPHGAICAALLAPVMAANIRALRSRAPQSSALVRYAEVARWLTGRNDASHEHGVEWVRSLVATLGIPRLSAYGLVAAHVAEIVTRAQQASSMKANPIALTIDELMTVLAEAI
jgi:alcohol dehydrogenase class IV